MEDKSNKMAVGRRGVMLMIAGVLVMIAGFILLSGGGIEVTIQYAAVNLKKMDKLKHVKAQVIQPESFFHLLPGTGAFIAVGDDALLAARNAMALMGVAGERAAQRMNDDTRPASIIRRKTAPSPTKCCWPI